MIYALGPAPLVDPEKYSICIYLRRNARKMKKLILSMALVLSAMISAAPMAYAEEYCTMGSCTAGTPINCYISEVAAEASVEAESLPSGCQLAEEGSDNGKKLYLRGTPIAAGMQMFALTVINGEDEYNILCSLEVQAATPVITRNGDVSCYVGDNTQLSVTASVSDGGALSYQWFQGNGIIINGAVDSYYSPDTSTVGVSQYYCKVTNTNNGRAATANSDFFTVSVAGLDVSSISIETLPRKTEYAVGDKLDTAGLTLRVNYTGGSGEVLSSGFGVYPTEFTKEGTQNVELSYQGKKCTFSVNVKSKTGTVDGIGVVTLPSKTKYNVGDKLETAGLSIRAYSGNEHYDVSTGLECSPTVLNTAGSQTITVTYSGKQCTFKVTVAEEKETGSISVVQKPTLLEYTVGDKLDTTGLTIRVTTNKGTEELSSGFSCSPKLLTKVGAQTISVVYGQYTATFSVNVKAKEQTTPTPKPTASPTASPTTSPTAKPSASPTAGSVTASPTYTPTQHESHSTRAGNTLVKVIMVVAMMALVGLGAYVYIMQRKGQR